MTTNRTVQDAVGNLTAHGEACGVCCRDLLHAPDAVAAGYLPGPPAALTPAGHRLSVPACVDCTTLVFACDWAGIESLVFAYMTSDWTAWDRLTDPLRGRRSARRTARHIAAAAKTLFGHYADTDALYEEAPDDHR